MNQIKLEPPPEKSDEKKRKVFPWIFLAVQSAFLLWVIVGGGAAQNVSCHGLDAESCKMARDAGTTIGIGLIIGLWVAVDVILALSYAAYLFTKRRNS